MEKGLLLMSGGIDSPVAGYLIKKRGFDLDAIHFSLEPFSDRNPEIKSRKLCKILGIEKLLVIQAAKVFGKIANKCEKKYYFILTKRFMLRTAEAIAKKEKHSFLVTGENLGQVSSQTLQNLVVIDKSVGIPVLRPLISYDKLEIIQLAMKIDTYEISKGPEICHLLGPKHPSTQAKEQRILYEEKKLDSNKIINEAIDKYKQ